MERTKVLQLKLRLLEKDVQSNVETLKELKSTEDRNVTELQEKIGLLHDTEQEVNIVADSSRALHLRRRDQDEGIVRSRRNGCERMYCTSSVIAGR